MTEKTLKAIVEKEISADIHLLLYKEKCTMDAITFLSEYIEWYKYKIVKYKVNNGAVHKYVIDDLKRNFGHINEDAISLYLLKMGYLKSIHVVYAAMFIFIVSSSIAYQLLDRAKFSGFAAILIIILLAFTVIFLESTLFSFKRYDVKRLKEIINNQEV